MNPVTHPSNTRTLNPPPGWDQDKLPVASVPVSDVRLGDVQAVATFWKPEPVELDALLLGGTVMLSVIGPTMPPVAVQVARATERHEPSGEPTREDLNALARACAVPGHATMIDHLAFGRLVLARHARQAMENAYARRYLYLRERPLDSIAGGGLFVGRTPENQVINGEDLDRAVDERIAAEWPAAPALRFGLDREALRQDLGEALTTALAAVCEDGVAPDWFDSRNVDTVLDEVMPTIRMHVDPEMVNAAWSASEPEPQGADAKCIACGCTDSRACMGGCSWAWVDREARQGLCSSCVADHVSAEIERAGKPLEHPMPPRIQGLGTCCHDDAPAAGFDPARALNGELRTEMLDMLRCMARGDLAERIKDEPLKTILAAIFTELSDADSDAQDVPKLHERIEALERDLAAAGDAPKQLAALNERLIAANAQVDALQLRLGKGGAA
ncbi:hypothetical protein DFR41_104255 [Pseudacidovorax intermedius]|uniref:Uncharacterized protein n=1 Tax=Pseudacidovorax intermedius TaxID=433924 RepID=A0A370FKT8_9BURK|nr:hypothetical protein [Pseudacidovorax intermedius]RDI25198.1 hypothetical protein DFR41_104255 [Pseudacidovorax intermedius]